MLNKVSGDNFFLGMLGGLVLLSASYLSLRSIRLAFADYYGNPYFFPAPRVELISILINVLVFRFVIVKFRKEQTGKGIFFITAILAFVYFFFFLRYHYRLP